MGHVHPVTSLSGVIASEAINNTRVQNPSRFRTSAMGLAPRASVAPCQAMRTTGRNATTPMAHLAAVSRRRRALTSEVLPQVHARVQRGDLVGVAVEWQRLALRELADAA